jgi:hypothetical protein
MNPHDHPPSPEPGWTFTKGEPDPAYDDPGTVGAETTGWSGSAAEDPDAWLDSAAGPLVRPYTVTRGRARSAPGLDILAFVEATPGGDCYRPDLQPEHRAILRYTGKPATVADVASHLDLPLGVVRVLLSDLLRDGLVRVYEPGSAAQTDEGILKAVIRELRAL